MKEHLRIFLKIKLDKICNAAIKIAKQVKYFGAGTVEFLFDKTVNFISSKLTQIQVEHTVTEEVTGIDI